MKQSEYNSYDDLPIVMSVPDVAKALGIAVATAYELSRREDFPAFKIGSRIMVTKGKFIEWLSAQSLDNTRKY